MKKQFLILTIMAIVLLAASPVSGENGKGEVIGVFEIVPGQDLIVHVVAVVLPRADRNEIAREALHNQGARRVDSADFSTTGLV